MSKVKGHGGISAMAFFHGDGFVPAWKQAMRFAGKEGRIATVPDIIEARMSTKPGEIPWERYFTTSSAEYVGRTKSGSRILIVAHGIGPMSALDGVLQAYSFQFKDKTRDRIGGRITYDEFYALESGKYGEVSIVDLDRYLGSYEYPFIERISGFKAAKNPLVKARLGKRADEYIERHYAFAREWHKEKSGLDEENRHNLPNWKEYLNRQQKAHLHYAEWMFKGAPILEMSDPNNCTYGTTPEQEKLHGGELVFPLDRHGLPLAHLLCISGLTNMMYHEEDCGNLVSDVGCHEWYDGVRVCAVKKDAPVNEIHAGPDNPTKLLYENWKNLMIPAAKQSRPGFFTLMKVGNNWFTEIVKKGHSMDSGEPEFLVETLEPIGKPVEFQVKVSGYYGFFRYSLKDVSVLKPGGANAYAIYGEPLMLNSELHSARAQFYRAKVDTSRRLMREKELINDFDLLMSLVEK